LNQGHAIADCDHGHCKNGAPSWPCYRQVFALTVAILCFFSLIFHDTVKWSHNKGVCALKEIKEFIFIISLFRENFFLRSIRNLKKNKKTR